MRRTDPEKAPSSKANQDHQDEDLGTALFRFATNAKSNGRSGKHKE